MENWEGPMPDRPNWNTHDWQARETRVFYSVRCETEESYSPHAALWVAILPSLQEMRSSKSVLSAISSWNSLCTAVEGHKVACHGADSSSFLPCCHLSICLGLLVEPLLDVWAVYALEDFSLFFTLFLPKVKNSPQARQMTPNPLALGRQLLFLQHSHATGPWVNWPTTVWISFLDEPCLFAAFVFFTLCG